MVPLEILRSLISIDIKFAQIGAWKEKLWPPKVGVSKPFFCVFPAKISAGEPRVACCSRGYPFS
jgi:hypothetical protein